jgi:hypothetical protein
MANMERFVRHITQRLIQKLPANEEYFQPEALRKQHIPEFIIDRIRVEMEQNLLESITPPYSEWADMKNSTVQEAWKGFADAIVAEARMPKVYAASIFETAVADTLDMLVQPRKNIPDTVFGPDKALDRDTLEKRIRNVVVYKHLGTAVLRFMERKELEAVTLNQCKTVVEKVDEKIISGYNPLNWAQLLEPLFLLIGDNVDTNMLRLFFEDKKRPRIARYFDKMNSSVSKSQLIEILSSPEMLDMDGFEEPQETLFGEAQVVKKPADEEKVKPADDPVIEPAPKKKVFEKEEPLYKKPNFDDYENMGEEATEFIPIDTKPKKGNSGDDFDAIADELKSDEPEAEEPLGNIEDSLIGMFHNRRHLYSDEDEDGEDPEEGNESPSAGDDSEEEESDSLANIFKSQLESDDAESDESSAGSVMEEEDHADVTVWIEEEIEEDTKPKKDITKLPDFLNLYAGGDEDEESDEIEDKPVLIDEDLDPDKAESTEEEVTAEADEEVVAEEDTSDKEEEVTLSDELTDALIEEYPPLEEDEAEEDPMWKRFLEKDDLDGEEEDDDEISDEPIIDLTVDPEKEAQEQASPLIKWMESDRERFVRDIFSDSDDTFEEALFDIAALDDWKSATRYIEKEVFSRNLVDMYDEAAVDFTDRLHTYFMEFKS